MMLQYRRIRKELAPDTLLFFRLGDFYEMFYEDAIRASEVLELTLTKRNKVPMCGLPYHQLDTYLARAVRAGCKVAICDQVEDPGQAKGIVRREVTRVVTPGTVLEEHVLEAGRNNFIAALARHGRLFGVALLDLSTGEFWLEESDSFEPVRQTLARAAPAECLLPEALHEEAPLVAQLRKDGERTLTARDDWTFELDVARDFLERHFGVRSLAGFGCDTRAAGICAAGGVLQYVVNDLHRNAAHVSRLRVQQPGDCMLVDETTVQNLDLLPSSRGGRAGTPSLLKALDTTRTAMGSRLLRAWLLRPSTDLATIQVRHAAVEALTKQRKTLLDLREAFGGIKDLERLIARVSSGAGNARDVKALGVSLGRLPGVKLHLAQTNAPRWTALNEAIEPLPELVELIERAIEDEAPVTLREGGMLRAGYNAELDELRNAASEGRRWLAEYQAAEQERTGIRSLKVRFNKVFGYYIEVTKSNLAQVPEDYVRKQTLVNAERFVTPQLKEYENKILGAQDRAQDLEYELFLELRVKVVAHTDAVQRIAAALAESDVLASFAERALAQNFACPAVDESTTLRIRDGRHPIIEQMPDADRFVPNDTDLDTLTNQVLIITGPNMAGKSTYIRQVALIVLMAQMGSFVPAREAHVGLVDRIFTRVGASDDLARGRSTFMVEMQETANILHNATPRSLVVLDEIGRGTSTFDGISIAWAVAEHLHNEARVKARTLFATHYHELTDLAVTLAGVQNYNVLVKETGDHIVFLRKIVRGAADKSYGIQVARLAGLPGGVVSRAHEILANLEEGEFAETGQPKIAAKRPRRSKEDTKQLSLFG